MSAISPAAAAQEGVSRVGVLTPSKVLLGVIAFGYAASLVFPVIVDYIALVPGKTIPFAWNLVTAAFFEFSLVGVAVSGAGLLVFGRLLEPVWGSKEFLKFILIIGFCSSVCTFMISILLYYITGHENLLYTPIAGMHGVLAGFLVAVKQIFPDHDVLSTTLPIVKLRAKWLPTLLSVVAIVLGVLLTNPIVYAPFLLFGTYWSWLYLRYFQRRSESTVTGDPSGEFGFRTFFPELLWPVINPLSTSCDKLCCGGRAKQLEADQGDDFVMGNPLPGSDPAEANRRRERGARALEERLVVASAANNKTAEV